jgi:molecular chaperone GrpE (heat shock protein)
VDEDIQQPPDPVVDRLERVEAQLAEFHRRSAHRESVIDRLHAENQEFRDGLRRVVLEPAVTDLVRLYDSMLREAQRLAGAEPVAAKLLESYADEVGLAVERCGYELFLAVVGEPFTSGRHTPAGTVPTADPAADNAVAEALSAGLLETETGKVRRPARARFFRYEAVDLALESASDQVGSE